LPGADPKDTTGGGLSGKWGSRRRRRRGPDVEDVEGVGNEEKVSQSPTD